MQIQRNLAPNGGACDEVRKRWKIVMLESEINGVLRSGAQVRLVFALGETRPVGWDETWETLYAVREEPGDVFLFWNDVLNKPLEWPDGSLVVAFGKYAVTIFCETFCFCWCYISN